MRAKIMVILMLVLPLASCDDLSIGKEKAIGGEPLALSELGNTFDVTSPISGVNISEAKVTNVDGGVSTTTLKVTVTNAEIAKWKDTFPYLKGVNGNVAEISLPGRVTEKGIQSVHDGEYFTLVEFDGNVGDTYKGKINGNSIVREVVAKSTDNDYFWGFMDIKVMQVEERGNAMPGLQKINYYANHKFGLVGVEAVFEDGSKKKFSIFSNK